MESLQLSCKIYEMDASTAQICNFIWIGLRQNNNSDKKKKPRPLTTIPKTKSSQFFVAIV